MEVSGRIDVGAPLTYVTELLDMKSILLDRVQRTHLHFTEALPMGGVNAEGMCQIDEALARKSGIDGLQVRLRLRGCRRCCGNSCEGSQKHNGCESALHGSILRSDR